MSLEIGNDSIGLPVISSLKMCKQEIAPIDKYSRVDYFSWNIPNVIG